MRRALAPLVLAVLAAVLLAGCSLPPPAPHGGDALPRVMAALGDSITRGVNLDGAAPGEHPEGSWATGNASFLRNASHAQRLLDAGALDGGVHNLARSGARMSDLERQAREAVAARAEYVAILMGANDACARSVEQMTPVETYRAGFRAAADVLAEGLPPGATVYVASVPNVTALWETHRDNPRAQAAWRAFRTCPVLLGLEATPGQRDEVTARVKAYNEVLREESGARGFAHDGGALFGTRLLANDVSDLDYFHPSFDGQRRLAEVTWAAGPLDARIVEGPVANA